MTAGKVPRHTLLASNFAAGQLPHGPAGPPGRTGSTGPAGPAGTARAYGAAIESASTTIVASPDNVDPTASSKAIAQVNSSATDCPAGDLEVEMRHLSVESTGVVAHHADNAFSFVVP